MLHHRRRRSKDISSPARRAAPADGEKRAGEGVVDYFASGARWWRERRRARSSVVRRNRGPRGTYALVSMRLRRRGDHWLLVGGPVPPGSAAITIGSVISIRRAYADDARLLRHEEEHVHQWLRAG